MAEGPTARRQQLIPRVLELNIVGVFRPASSSHVELDAARRVGAKTGMLPNSPLPRLMIIHFPVSSPPTDLLK
jgi:hypothetical protein